MSLHVESAPDISSAAADTYRDRKRYAWLLYPLWLLLPVMSVVLVHATGHAFWYWLTPAYLFVAMPLLDLGLGSDTANAPKGAAPRLEEDRYYRYVTYLCVALHYLSLVVGAWVMGTQSLDWAGYTGMTVSAGLISAFGIVTAHELGHKKAGLERWLAKIALATGAYGQYMTDHNRGHHRDVATPEDSGSARFGENFYAFMVKRQLPHSTALRPWQLEKERLARKGKGPWNLENEVIQPALISLATYAILIAAFGPIVIPYLLAVAFTSYFFLAFIDYIEHYGLVREKQADGRYARVRPEHSWNTDHMASNIMYMHAQRHSDHHAYPTRRYQVLRSFPDLPTMPSGYPGMFWLAVFPPLWRAVMYPRLLELHDYDLNRINVDPRQRDMLFRRYSRVPDKRTASLESTPPAAAATVHEHRHAHRGLAAYKCPGCGYTYRELDGDPSQGFASGTRWSEISPDWSCPDCSVRDKADFIELPVLSTAGVKHG